MKIKQASMCDFEKIISFYNVMCAVLGEKDFLPDGNKGGFPSQNMVRDAIYSGSQFIGVENDKIVAAYIMNHDCDNAYHTVQWHIDAAENEVVVLHALRVLPDYGGRGYSKQLVEHAIQTAKSWGQKAIRLDCIVGNDVPMKVYTSFGFEYVGTAAKTDQDSLNQHVPYHDHAHANAKCQSSDDAEKNRSDCFPVQFDRRFSFHPAAYDQHGKQDNRPCRSHHNSLVQGVPLGEQAHTHADGKKDSTNSSHYH